LLNAAGIPKANLVWTVSKADKWRLFGDNHLTHFIDDQVEVLINIRDWERRNEIHAPALFLVPTAWDGGRLECCDRTCAAAAAANSGWFGACAIHPRSSVDQVRPWEDQEDVAEG
jgi:hypothetical protein